ncbi:hypothetical protein [Ferrimicrobium acidiphilum]|jgi:hypothetical protein|uniref:hypothetical protein n=1 Tax=Ferrimicrobium acidiphilum TaxID=121039 RepID=UPI0023F34027|nr:hypothetical protein [Ferrimicrobium acidiphilum]
MPALLATVDLVSQWGTFMSDLNAAPGITTIMNALGVIGAVIVVLALLRWLWDIRRSGSFKGSGGGHHKLAFSVIVGSILAAPTFVIPIFLTILDLLANAVFPFLSHL